MIRVVSLTLLLLCVMKGANSLDCLSCSGPSCENPNLIEVKTCEAPPGETSPYLNLIPVCMKVVKEIKGDTFVVKYCSLEGSQFEACDKHNSAEYCSMCVTNLCNTSRTLQINIMFILIGFFITSLWC